MLSRIQWLSNYMVSSRISRPLGSVSGALCRQGGSLVVSRSMILVWLDVRDGAI